ncbi:hypothetical protein GCM10008967_32750 [Bacillus carboniphilus]|uniref:Aminoglycoside phosphotransferase domain-containing protein n=1 Tax=Bacillus carboniphilus TaxID=86663 RepID=A0ABP3G9F7_9BACI
MDIRRIIKGVIEDANVSFEQVNGGFDSSVWKVETATRKKLALRIVTADRYEDFLMEKEIIDFAASQMIPAPAVRTVKIVDDLAVMVSDWVSGQTVLEELISNPEQAFSIGEEFGRVQAKIHNLRKADTLIQIPGNWLKPATDEEKDVFEKIDTLTKEDTKTLLHLDYHPLNVMMEIGKITAVLDWVNAGFGDPRLDVARTYSILQFEQLRQTSPFEELKPTLQEFEKGWLKGYTEIAGELKSIELFHKWAGIRHARDLGDRITEEDRVKLHEWSVSWR